MRLTFGLAFLLSLASSIAAQTTSTITGEVKDTNSALLVGVRITATALETGVKRTTSSGPEGRFVFPALPVGTYELRAEHDGFEPLVPQTVRLTVNETVHISLVLKIAGLTANVIVDSGESLVNTESAELSYLVSERLIRDLPLNGRNYTDLTLATWRCRVHPSRWRVSSRSRACYQHQRSGSSFQRLPPGWHAAKRFHKRTSGQRGRYGAWRRNHQGVSRRSKFLWR